MTAATLPRLEPRPIQRMKDGTVKQRNPLTGTQVWTVPGRGHRPLTAPNLPNHTLSAADHTNFCAFCADRYFDTPPEKSRLVRQNDGTFVQMDALPAEELHQTVADFRRIPNLFEIVSYDYWNLNHRHYPTEAQHRRMAEYLASPAGYDHVLRVVRMKLKAQGQDDSDLDDSQLLNLANGLFSGGHDVLVARRHFQTRATGTRGLAGAGTLSLREHSAYLNFTADTIQDLYNHDEHVKYVVAFQNWLKPSGASFEHLHKQVVAIDEIPVQISEEIEQIARRPEIYHQILAYASRKSLLIAGNDGAVAFADFGHRFPTIAIWPLGEPRAPWEYSPGQWRDVSDVLHAVHAATGVLTPCNEEWYYRPPSCEFPVRTRILLKWRVSTLAGFEGGSRIYLNTIDPWALQQRVTKRMHELREAGTIAPLRLGAECKLDSLEVLGPLH